MSTTPGMRIGVYEVLGLLGEGGMGTVYRARDMKLDRDVAIKVLPESFASDPERLMRFEREAKTLASLNHPNIAGIYGIEDGPAEAGHHVRALVMELVEGEDLSARIARLRAPGASARQAGMPLDEALPIARQIAEALEAAHEQGIIHRDLKPANIKVRPDGTVKVLDFGLAKAIDQGSGTEDRGSGQVANSPTITSPAMTQAGMILGTAAYMSPEQAAGKPVDKRTDLWAFGVVLLEMLTGRRVFEGETVSHVIAAVLTKDPDWTALPADTPAPVKRLLRRCLEKDRRQRLADAADARLEIDDAIKAPAPEIPTPVAAPARPSRNRLAWAIAGVATGAAVAFAVMRLGGGGRAAVVPEQARVEIITPATPDPGSIALSPDGEQIAFVATDDSELMLWVRSLATGQARTVKGTAGAMQPFWSPDNRFIAFFADGQLKRVDLAGTTVTEMAPASVPGGGAWHRQGGILYAASGTGRIQRVDPADGTRLPVTTLGPGQAGHGQPEWLPDGQHFVYVSIGTPEARGVWIASIDGSPAQRLLDAELARIVPPSTLLFVRQNTLFAQALAADGRRLSGEPRVVAPLEDGRVERGLSVSSNGTIAWRAGGRQQTRYQWFDRRGRPEPADDEAEQMRGARAATLSRDGRFLAVDRSVDGNTDVWIKDMTRGVFTRLTVNPDFDRFPTWTPDGRTIVFASRRDNAQWDLFARAPGGAGEDELLLSTPNTKHPLEFSADGRLLLYEEFAEQRTSALWTLQMSDRKPSALVTGARRGTFSPDGRWLAYESGVSGRSEIYVQPFPGPGDRVQVSRDGGVQARWRADGRELYFVGLDRQLLAVSVGVSGGDRAIDLGRPAPLFLSALRNVATGPERAEYLVAPDGQRFFMNAGGGEGAQAPMHLILNWRAPTP